MFFYLRKKFIDKHIGVHSYLCTVYSMFQKPMEEILSLWSKKKILNEHGSTCKQSRHVGKLYMHFNIFYQKNVTHILQQLLIKEIPRHYSLIYPECHQLIIRYDHGNITLRKLFKTTSI